MVYSVSGWTRGVQVKLWDPLRTRAIPERLRGVFTTRRYTNPRLLWQPLQIRSGNPHRARLRRFSISRRSEIGRRRRFYVRDVLIGQMIGISAVMSPAVVIIIVIAVVHICPKLPHHLENVRTFSIKILPLSTHQTPSISTIMFNFIRQPDRVEEGLIKCCCAFFVSGPLICQTAIRPLPRPYIRAWVLGPAFHLSFTYIHVHTSRVY